MRKVNVIWLAEKEEEEEAFDEINEKTKAKTKKQAVKITDENKEIYNIEKSDSGDEEEHIISGEEEADMVWIISNKI